MDRQISFAESAHMPLGLFTVHSPNAGLSRLLLKLRHSLLKRISRAVAYWRASRRAEVVRLGGIRIPLDRARFSDKIIRRLYEGTYEKTERIALEHTLKSCDTVLELGTGIGYISAVAARQIGSDRVVTVEADESLAGLIDNLHRRNAVKPAVRYGVMSVEPGSPTRVFYRHSRNLWSSALDIPQGAYERIIVPAMSWSETLAELRPTYIVMDIEGGEIELLMSLDDTNTRRLLIEFHPRKTGAEAIGRVFRHLRSIGFKADLVAADTHIYYFER